MKEYRAEIPVKLEYLGAYDTHDSSSDFDIELKTAVEVQLNTISASFVKTGIKTFLLTIEGVKENTQNDALPIITELASFVCTALSYSLFQKNPNQHYGHPRFVFENKTMRIRPFDQSIGESVSFSLIQQVNDVEGFKELATFMNDQKLKTMLTLYYFALQSQDLSASYFNAFRIIELLEQEHGNEFDKILDEKDIEPLNNVLTTELERLEYNIEEISLFQAIFQREFTKATMMPRLQKLVSIISNIYGIARIESGALTYTIDEEILRKFINTRNKLFHGVLIEGIKELTDKLILLCAEIIATRLRTLKTSAEQESN